MVKYKSAPNPFVKNVTELVTSLISGVSSRTSEITDFSASSIVRSIIDAIAMQIQQFYILTTHNINDGIEEGMANGLGLVKRKERVAYGKVTVIFDDTLNYDYVINEGTSFTTANRDTPLVFKTIEPYTIPAGNASGQVVVYCNVPGTVGNIDKNEITNMSSDGYNDFRVTNDEPFITGQDAETQANFQKRVNECIQALGRSTKESIAYAAKKDPNITGVYIDDSYTGMIKIYCHDSNGDLLPTDKDKVIQNINNPRDEYLPAGIAWQVLPVTKKKIPINATVSVTDMTQLTNNVKASIEQVIVNYLNTRAVGDDVSLSQINRLILNLTPNYITDADVTIPTNQDLQDQATNAQDILSDDNQDIISVNTLIRNAQYDNTVTASNLMNLGNDYVLTANEIAQIISAITQAQANNQSDQPFSNSYNVTTANEDLALTDLMSFMNDLSKKTKPVGIDYTSYRTLLTNYYQSRLSFLNNVHDAINKKQQTDLLNYNNIQQQVYNATHTNFSIGPSELARPDMDNIDVRYQTTTDTKLTAPEPYDDTTNPIK